MKGNETKKQGDSLIRDFRRELGDDKVRYLGGLSRRLGNGTDCVGHSIIDETNEYTVVRVTAKDGQEFVAKTCVVHCHLVCCRMEM